MTRLTILALTISAALLASTHATAQGKGPQGSQIDSRVTHQPVMFRLVVAQGEAKIAEETELAETDENLPVIADYSDLPSELWQLRPEVQNALPNRTGM
mgnify:FL=1